MSIDFILDWRAWGLGIRFSVWHDWEFSFELGPFMFVLTWED